MGLADPSPNLTRRRPTRQPPRRRRSGRRTSAPRRRRARRRSRRRRPRRRHRRPRLPSSRKLQSRLRGSHRLLDPGRGSRGRRRGAVRCRSSLVCILSGSARGGRGACGVGPLGLQTPDETLVLVTWSNAWLSLSTTRCNHLSLADTPETKRLPVPRRSGVFDVERAAPGRPPPQRRAQRREREAEPLPVPQPDSDRFSTFHLS